VSEAPNGLALALADRYRIDLSADGRPRPLGQGGMATVYLAVDLKHERKVAIKLLRPNVAGVVGPERFLQEIRVTANLQHPHILSLLDSGVVDVEVDDRVELRVPVDTIPAGPPSSEGLEVRRRLPYYVMPYVEGESLRQKLTRETQLPLDEALEITRQVASALDYAHRHGVIHRDIKPENILLHEGQALVADFGIALALSAAGGTRLTDTGLALGTPQYMSPEQSLGQRDVTARTDIYALGCVLYEMLAGEPPFTGPTAQVIAAKVAQDTPRPIRAGRPSVPASVELAVSKALAKLPADHYGRAGELLAALASGGARETGALIPAPAGLRTSRVIAVLSALAARGESGLTTDGH